MSGKRNYIALYKTKEYDDWRLITREVATKKHAEKKAAEYEKHNYITKIIKIEK
jgi:hypothetical protein